MQPRSFTLTHALRCRKTSTRRTIWRSTSRTSLRTCGSCKELPAKHRMQYSITRPYFIIYLLQYSTIRGAISNLGHGSGVTLPQAPLEIDSPKTEPSKWKHSCFLMVIECPCGLHALINLINSVL